MARPEPFIKKSLSLQPLIIIPPPPGRSLPLFNAKKQGIYKTKIQREKALKLPKPSRKPASTNVVIAQTNRTSAPLNVGLPEKSTTVNILLRNVLTL